MIKLVLADMDNTLLPGGADQVPDLALEGVRRLTEAGIHFAPASGRSLPEINHFFRTEMPTAITGNGIVVYLDGTTLAKTPLDNAHLKQVNDILRTRDNFYLTATSEDGGTHFFEGALPTGQAAYEIELIAPQAHDDVPADITFIKAGIVVAGGWEASYGIAREMAERAPWFQYMASLPVWNDIVPLGISKAYGIDLIAQALGIKPEEIVAFGDSENDLEMLSYVGHPVCVANAVPQVKEACEAEVGSCADCGVGTAMLEIAEATRRGELPSWLKS